MTYNGDSGDIKIMVWIVGDINGIEAIDDMVMMFF